MKSDLEDLSVIELDNYDAALLIELEALELEDFAEAGLTRWTLPFFIRHGKVFALYAGEELAGLCESMRDFDDPKRVFIAGFSVREKFRGRGAGSFFLGTVLPMLIGEADEILLTAAPDNTAAAALYIKHGFRETGLLKDYFGPGEDRMLMKLRVNS